MLSPSISQSITLDLMIYHGKQASIYNIISLDRPSILLCLLMYVGYNIAYRVGIILRLFSVGV